MTTKKLFLTMAALALLPNLLQAQNMYRYSYAGTTIYPNSNLGIIKPDSLVLSNKVHTRTFYTQELKKGKLVTKDSTIYEYNSMGCYIASKNYGPKQKIHHQYNLIYDAMGRVLVEKTNWYKSFVIENNTYADTIKVPTSCTITQGRKGRTKHSVFSQNYFNNKNQIIESNSIVNGDARQTQRFIYERAYNGNVEKIKVYDYKNKLSYMYNYSCDKNGKLELDQKKMQSTCLLKNRLANGHWQSIQITEHAFGINRTVFEYDSLDNLVSTKHYRGKKGEILSSADSNWKIGDTTYRENIYFTVTHKGKYKGKSTYLSKMILKNQYVSTIRKTTNMKNKASKYTIDYYSYNDKGMISETKVVNLLDKTEYKKFVKYEYFE